MTGKGGARAPILYNGKEFRATFTISRKSKTAFTAAATRTRSVSVSRPLIEPHGVGRARARPGTDVLYSSRRCPSGSQAAPVFCAWCSYSRKLVHRKRSIMFLSARRASTCNKTLLPRRRQRDCTAKSTQGHEGF